MIGDYRNEHGCRKNFLQWEAIVDFSRGSQKHFSRRSQKSWNFILPT